MSHADIGKWIAFAFVAGMVLIGFKSRQLKWYEFLVSGVFMLLLDRLVFSGQISSWIGQIGSKAQGAASHGALHGGLAFPFLFARGKGRRFAAKVWEHRPGWSDYLLSLAVVMAAHYGWSIAWPIGFGIYALVTIVVTVAATIIDATRNRTPSPTDVGAAQLDPTNVFGTSDGDEGVGVDG